MRLPGSLRARITLATVATLALVLLGTGIALLAAIERDGRDAVDVALQERARGVTGGGPGPFGRRGRLRGGPGPRRGGPEPLLAGSGTFVQLAVGPDLIEQQGDVPGDAPPVPEEPGLRTVPIAGEDWRSLTVLAPTRSGAARLELLQSLAPVEARVARVRRIVLGAGALALLLTGLATAALTSLALAPLARLRAGATAVGGTADLATVLPDREGPDEVRALGASLNEMLARLRASTEALQRALEATRRFAADAGHELRTPLTGLRANVDVLRRNPDLPEAERDAVLREVATEQERIVHLLDGLTALARGEAADALPREQVELGDLLDTAVGAARRRHPAITWVLEEDVGRAGVYGWPEGLRLMVDNLLENAARHGRADGRVTASLARTAEALVLRVDDDGPGIPPGEREALFEPFRRGVGARGAGTGLGLAIAAQQAGLHGGALRLDAAPAGGLRVEVTLAQTPGGSPKATLWSSGTRPT